MSEVDELRAELKRARQKNGRLAERIHELREGLKERDAIARVRRGRIRRLEGQVGRLKRRVSKEQSRADRALNACLSPGLPDPRLGVEMQRALNRLLVDLDAAKRGALRQEQMQNHVAWAEESDKR